MSEPISSGKAALQRGESSFGRNVNAGSAVLPGVKNGNGKSWLEDLGGKISLWVSDIAANPFAQVGFLLFCGAWFLTGWDVNVLTAALSILAITLTQMVLNRQNERELEDRRRDVAMHAKLDELISASKQARNKFVDLEDREEEEIVQMKEEVKEAIEETTEP